MRFARAGLGFLVLVAFQVLLAAGLFGCSGGTTSGAVEALTQRFPAHADRVLGGVDPFVVQEGGFGVSSSTAARDGLVVKLPARGGDAMHLETRHGLGVRVREVGAEAEGALTGNVVAYAGPGRASFWSATLGGYEQWLLLEAEQVRADAPVTAWEVEGATVRMQRDVVELCDAAGVARVRVTAREAYGAGGRKVGVRLRVVGSRIELWVDASGEEVLVDPEWTSTGTMVEARADHTATSLPDGRVLAAGGGGISFALTSAELYDPMTEVWTPTVGDMADGRVFHTATLLSNGKVLVAAGANDNSEGLSTAELFNPATGLWSLTDDTEYVHMVNSTATRLPNGKVLLTGGYVDGNRLSAAELYDPATGMWGQTTPMNFARYQHTATLLPQTGEVLVAGGYAGNSLTAELYDPLTGTWTITGDMTSFHRLHTATLLPNGMVLCAGSFGSGTVAELYDPLTEMWSPTGNMTSSRSSHTATLLPNSKLLVTGGYDYYGPDITLSKTEIFDPTTGIWSQLEDMISARSTHTATLLPNGKILLAGGRNDSDIALSIAEVYDPRFSIWIPTGQMTSARAYHTATRLQGGKVLVAGGIYVNGGHYATAELYDPVTGMWSNTASNMIYPHAYHTATLLIDGMVLVVSGSTFPFNVSQQAELYNPETGAWTQIMDYLIVGRDSHSATRLDDGKVLVVGGAMLGGNWAVLAEPYDPMTQMWLEPSSLAVSRAYHTATLLEDGAVLAAGGDFTNNPTAEIFDPGTNWWSPTGEMTINRYRHTATRLLNGKVLAVGGDNGVAFATAELYDRSTNTWTATGDMTSARTSHTATLLNADHQGTNHVLVTGGELALPLVSAEVYNPTTGAWQEVSPLLEARRAHTATKLEDGRVLVVGGIGEDGIALATAELYSRSSNGTLCLFDADCMSAFCTDGVCCESACEHDGCHACSFAAGSAVDGVCTTFAEDTLCTDNDACTAIDTCQAGQCVGAPTTACPGPADDCHLAELCNGITGECDEVRKPDGTVCDQSCAIAAVCQAGACTTVVPDECPTLDECHNPGTCDPLTGTCDNPAKDEGAACDDGDPTTQLDRCEAGTCIGKCPVTCPEPDACHNSGACDGATGVCDYPAKDNGVPCSDGDPCTDDDHCVTGECVSSAPTDCGDNLRCNPESGCPAQCAFVTDCLDGFVCDPSRRCMPEPPKQGSYGAGCHFASSSATSDEARFAALGLLLAAALAPVRRRRRHLTDRNERPPSAPA